MRIVTFRWARDAMAAGRRQVTRSPGRNADRRTAKSCGPGAATLASIPAAPLGGGVTVTIKAAHRGEHV